MFYHSGRHRGTKLSEIDKGICPNCEGTGSVGKPCPEAICSRRGYHRVPADWFEKARQFAAKKQRPLDPLLGRMLERYLLAGKLGEGGMGAVYLGIQHPLNREVAVKLISGVEMSDDALARFQREALAISTLDHPNIVKLYDYGIGNLGFKVPFMAIEYVRHGRTMRRALQEIRYAEGGRIPGTIILDVFRQTLNGLGAAHDMGIIHRDMKPENIMVTAVRGNPHMVKILDFGLAKAVEDVSGWEGDVSRTGQFLGTPFYMAPEQAKVEKTHTVSARADLYAVGTMLYEVFTGVRPYDGTSALEILAKKSDPSEKPLEKVEALTLPRGLVKFLERALSADPDGRPADAATMLAELERAISGHTTSALGMLSFDVGSSKDRPSTPADSRIPGESAGSVQVRPVNTSFANASSVGNGDSADADVPTPQVPLAKTPQVAVPPNQPKTTVKAKLVVKKDDDGLQREEFVDEGYPRRSGVWRIVAMLAIFAVVGAIAYLVLSRPNGDLGTVDDAGMGSARVTTTIGDVITETAGPSPSVQPSDVSITDDSGTGDGDVRPDAPSAQASADVASAAIDVNKNSDLGAVAGVVSDSSGVREVVKADPVAPSVKLLKKRHGRPFRKPHRIGNPEKPSESAKEKPKNAIDML